MKRTLLIIMLGCMSMPTTPLMSQEEPSERPFWRPVVMGTHGMVAAEHPLEAMAGWKILEAGGNAFDAATAVFYMTTVVEQHQAGMGMCNGSMLLQRNLNCFSHAAASLTPSSV